MLANAYHAYRAISRYRSSLALVGVLFIGVSWKSGANKAACVVNLSSIQKAARGYANMNGLSPGSAEVSATLTTAGFWQTAPVCPAAGHRRVGRYDE